MISSVYNRYNNLKNQSIIFANRKGNCGRPRGYKQEAHGPHNSPFKHLFAQSFDFTICNVDEDRERKKIISFLRIKWSWFVITWIPFTKRCFVPSLVETYPAVQEKMIFRFRRCIFAISLDHLPLGRAWPFKKTTWIAFTQRCFNLYQIWCKLALWFWRIWR